MIELNDMGKLAGGGNFETEHNTAWFRALNLSERVANSTFPADAQPVDSKAAARLERWKKVQIFSQGTFFEQRLAADNLTEESLRFLLAETPRELKDRLAVVPGWLKSLRDTLSQPVAPNPSLAAWLDSLEIAPFARACLRISGPWLNPAFARLEHGLVQLTQSAPTSPTSPFQVKLLVELFLTNLAGQIPLLFMRTTALEVNLARLKSRLSGETPEERFNDFVAQLTEPKNLLKFFEEYSVLARLIQTMLAQWVNVSLEFAGRLQNDWPLLYETFFANTVPGPLVKLEGGAGDQHRGGRSVLKLKFENGQKLVYKPHSLALDLHFQELLGWLNLKLERHEPRLPQFRTIRILDRDTYGWSEFVEAGGCSTKAEVERFYQRQGAFLALLYALEATDFHSENLIAAGEEPVLVDLEALFHPRLSYGAGLEFQNPAFLPYEESLVRIGLLPERYDSNEENAGFDISGLGNHAGQISGKPGSFMDELATDRMHLIHKRFEVEENPNRPTLNGVAVDILDYLEDVTGGFSRMYLLLAAVRSELLAGPLQAFRQDEIRVIVRPTALYDQMLRESYHPNYLRDALDRERIFDRLWGMVKWKPELARLIRSEREDLWQGDIPFFYAPVNSRDIFNSQHQPIPGFLAASGFEGVQTRLNNLTEEDLARQLWVIQATFATVPLGKGEGAWKGSAINITKVPQTNQRELLSMAETAGKRLVKLAFKEGDYASWLGVSLFGEREWKLQPVSSSLYDGNAGIAFFLAYLGTLSRDETFTRAARATLNTVRAQVKELRSFYPTMPIGGYGDYMALVYLYTHLAKLWNEPGLLDEADALVEGLTAQIEADKELDVLEGTAGCLAVLLSLYRARPSRLVLETAIKCGEHLLKEARAIKNGQAIYWKSLVPSLAPLTGFSHGTTGIGFNLLRLGAVTGRADFKQTFQAATAYERQIFSEAANNWPDYRAIRYSLNPNGEAFSETPDPAFKPGFMTTWCHGAPGIGMARLASIPLLDTPDPLLSKDVENALQATLAHGVGHNHSLCHGDLGNLELFLQTSQAGVQSRAELDYLLDRVVESIKTHGWVSGIPLGIETPGLMSGLTGIGYGLLRMVRPDFIPSVLLLDPPMTDG